MPRGSKCGYCGKKWKEHTRKKSDGSIEIIGELYNRKTCSDDCRRKIAQKLREERMERKEKLGQLRREFEEGKRNGKYDEVNIACDYECVGCGSTEKIEKHHIKPLHLGGTNEIYNLIVLCKDCHMLIMEKSNSKVKKWLTNPYYKDMEKSHDIHDFDEWCRLSDKAEKEGFNSHNEWVKNPEFEKARIKCIIKIKENMKRRGLS